MTYSATANQVTHVLQRLYRRLGGKVTTATGGSTSTAIDTKLAEDLAEGNQDDIFNGGTIIVIKDAGGANAAPEGELSRITDYSSAVAAPTVTLSPAITTAIASGDKVMLVGSDFPLYDMLEVLNDALQDVGLVPLPDTSITTANNQTEYDLALTVKGREILDVLIQQRTNDSNDNQWVPVANFSTGPTAAGSVAVLYLPQFASGYNIKIIYAGKHPRVEAFDDGKNQDRLLPPQRLA